MWVDSVQDFGHLLTLDKMLRLPGLLLSLSPLLALSHVYFILFLMLHLRKQLVSEHLVIYLTISSSLISEVFGHTCISHFMPSCSCTSASGMGRFDISNSDCSLSMTRIVTVGDTIAPSEDPIERLCVSLLYAHVILVSQRDLQQPTFTFQHHSSTFDNASTPANPSDLIMQ